MLVKVTHTQEIEVTSENERDVLDAEWMRRYGEREFTEGDFVRFARDGRARHIEAFGPDHTGKLGVVTSLSDNGADVKVLAIGLDGIFAEFWTPESCLVRAD